MPGDGVGGLLALTGFFVPWWVTSGFGHVYWYGPVFVLLGWFTASPQGGSPACGETALLTLLLLSELVMCITGAAAFKPRRFHVAMQLGLAVSVSAAALGILGLVCTQLGVSFGAELSYPYTAWTPFLGLAFMFLGLCLVLWSYRALWRAYDV